LITKEQLYQLEQRIRKINDVSPILPTERASVPLDSVLNIHAFEVNRALQLDPHLGECHSGGEQHSHVHDSSINTISLRIQGEISSLEDFNRWLGKILWEDDPSVNIFRCKGVVCLKGEKSKLVLQGVHTLFEVECSNVFWEEGETRVNQLVFIGRGLNQQQLQQSFQAECLNTKIII